MPAMLFVRFARKGIAGMARSYKPTFASGHQLVARGQPPVDGRL